MPPIVVAAAIMSGVSAGVSVYEGQKQATAAKKAANAASDQQAQAIAQMNASQQAASTQAQNAMKQRQTAAIASQDVYTNPLGIAGQAQLNKKTLLGQ